MAVDLKKQLSNNIWVEAFRPPSVKDMVLPDKYREDFISYIQEGRIPNLLFYSSSGGKLPVQGEGFLEAGHSSPRGYSSCPSPAAGEIGRAGR